MLRTMLAAAAVTVAGTMAFADPVEGIWATTADDNGNSGHIEVTPCGDAFCGTLIRAYDSSGSQISTPNVGRRIIWDMKPQGGGKYAKGKVYSPDRDKTYNSRIQLSGDTLKVSGCVLGICRDGGTWKRVN